MLESLLPVSLRRSPDALLPIRRFEVALQEANETPRSPVAARLAEWQTRVPQYPPANFQGFVTKGFRHNDVFRRCVGLLADSFCQGRLRVVEGETGQEIVGHDLTAMIRRGGKVRPHPAMTESVLWTELIQDLYTFGNGLWEKVRSQTGKVVELWRLEPRRIAVESDDRLFIRRYLYQVGGKWWPIPRENVVHWMFPDPLQPWFGIPPILSAHRSLQVDNELIDHFKVTLQNYAIPAVVLSAKENLREEEVREARKAWRKNLGRWRRGDVAVVGGETTVQVIGLDMKKMAIGELIATSEARIAMVHGVPMILLGRSGTQADPTRANYAEAKEHFWLDTVSSLHSRAAELISTHLLTEWDQDASAGLEADFDVSGVAILQEAKARRVEKVTPAFQAGLLSRHRAQELSGVELHGPDVFYRRGVEGVIPADAEQEIIELTEL